MGRQVIIDVETTGTDIVGEDRVIAVGIIELFNNIETDRSYYQEFNPGSVNITAENYRIHGLSNEYLKSKPLFDRKYADEILKFISNSDIIIHNAQFDILFLRKEFRILGIDNMLENNKIVCTVELSRNVLPIFHVGLDKVASYFELKTRGDQYHNALDDCRLLAKVYYLLMNKQEKKHESKSLWDRFHPLKKSEPIDIFKDRKMNVDFKEFLNLMRLESES